MQCIASRLAVMALVWGSICYAPTRSEDEFYQGPGVSPAEILRGRGYQADEMFITTSAGYVLRITRGRNPLIEGGHLDSKEPILFVHGLLVGASNFLLNSFDVKPKDFTQMNISSMSLDELNKRLAGEPSARVLPFLALNFGHEVWLLDRRGVFGSQQLLGDPNSVVAKPSGQGNNSGSLIGSIVGSLGDSLLQMEAAEQVRLSLDQKFWNYSLDEQARVDFPETVDFILEHSRSASKVSVVGHSAGGAITLMALSLDPVRLGGKISRSILWAPAFATNNDNPLFSLTLSQLAPLEAAISAPIPPTFTIKPAQSALMVSCAPPITWTTTCEATLDVFFGRSGGQQPVKPQLLGGFLIPSSSKEVAQLEQTLYFPPNHTIHFFDHGRRGNMAAYGQPRPPAYDLSTLKSSPALSFYASNTDSLVTPSDVEKTRQQLTVPYEYRLIDTTFNHVGYFFHVDAPRLAIVPSMYQLETMN